MTALSRQEGGTHYIKRKIQPVEFIRANRYDFFAGNIFKYVVRWPDKGGIADLEKAVQYAEFLRDLRVGRPLNRVVRWSGDFIDAVWRWRERYPRVLREITVWEFVTANGIGERETHILYSLDACVRGEIEPMWFVQTLKHYVEQTKAELQAAKSR